MARRKRLRVRSEEERERLRELSVEFMHEVARLVMAWANCETWLIHILARLLGTSWSDAQLVFNYVTSARARVELVQRAAIMFLPRKRDVLHLNRLLKSFKKVTTTRNMVCHSEYDLDSTRMAFTGMIVLNFGRSDFDGTNHDEYRRVDRNLIHELEQATERAFSLMSSFERFAISKSLHVSAQPRDTPLLLRPRQQTKGRPRNPKKAKGQPRRRRPSRK